MDFCLVRRAFVELTGASSINLRHPAHTLRPAILAGVILFPPARELFHFGPLHGDDITVALAAGLMSLLLLELAKRLMQPFFSVRHPQTGTITR